MGIKDTLLKIVACGATIASAIFYIFFKHEKNKVQEQKIEKLQEEKQEAEVKAETAEQKAEIVEAVQKAENEVKESYEDKVQEAVSSHKLSNYHAAMSILSDD